MRGAMVGLGAGFLTTLGLNALFGNRHHDRDPNAPQGAAQAVAEGEEEEAQGGLGILLNYEGE